MLICRANKTARLSCLFIFVWASPSFFLGDRGLRTRTGALVLAWSPPSRTGRPGPGVPDLPLPGPAAPGPVSLISVIPDRPPRARCPPGLTRPGPRPAWSPHPSPAAPCPPQRRPPFYRAGPAASQPRSVGSAGPTVPGPPPVTEHPSVPPRCPLAREVSPAGRRERLRRKSQTFIAAWRSGSLRAAVLAGATGFRTPPLHP